MNLENELVVDSEENTDNEEEEKERGEGEDDSEDSDEDEEYIESTSHIRQVAMPSDAQLCQETTTLETCSVT